MSESGAQRDWSQVERYLSATLVHEDEALAQARRASAQTTAPGIEVAPNAGKLLYLIARLTGARRVLEFGTLAGYSTIWLARGVGDDGHVITLEAQPQNATVANASFEAAGVAERVELILGPAAESAQRLIASGAEPFDLFFIDADKPRYPEYLAACLKLAHPGSVIIADNVVRGGMHGRAVTDADASDPQTRGMRRFLDQLGAHPQLEATALQTVGQKGWDGFALATVKGIA